MRRRSFLATLSAILVPSCASRESMPVERREPVKVKPTGGAQFDPLSYMGDFAWKNTTTKR